MDRRKSLMHFVMRAKRSLNIEKSIPSVQYGLLLAMTIYTAILLISRLFVFPYYSNVAFISGISVIIGVIIYIWWNRVKMHDALVRLDSFYPHNELMTSLSFKESTNPLVDSILQKAQKASEHSFAQFKQRKRQLWRPKALIAIVLMMIVVGSLYIFPSPTQTEAINIEKENKVVDELEKDVAQIEKKTVNKEVKTQLQELLSNLKAVDSSEEALREVVKKQKELKLQEQNLRKKQSLAGKGEEGSSDDLTANEKEQLKALQEIQSALANSASSTQTALSKLGKSLSFDLKNAIAQESNSTASGKSNSENDEKSQNDDNNQQNGSSNQQNNGQNSQANGNNQGGNNGSQGQGANGSQGQGGSSGQGKGSGSGQGQGQGQGNGSGNGGQGSGTGGSGAGFGQGSKTYLSIPERIGENQETVVDGGTLGDGTPIGEKEGPVPVTKGTIRPYEEVIGQYKNRYMESSERMQLPKDLQTIVQSYFSSIE